MPVVQLVVLALVLLLAITGNSPVSAQWVSIMGWLGYTVMVTTTLIAIVIDRSWRELKYLYVLPLWIPYSLFMNFVALRALYLELTGAQAKWNKLTRTGVVSRGELST
jgi:prepilin signal peptidase PulO-like enzyme (type II secretory pathway)